jgi:hypothetical protein
MTNVYNFIKKDVSVAKPTDNQIDLYQSFLNRLIRYLEFHGADNSATRPAADSGCIRNAVVRASYVTILFDRLLEQDGGSISVEYDMIPQMKQIIALSSDMVHETIRTPVAISTIVEIDHVLQSIIETYYFNQVKRPWWKFWG